MTVERILSAGEPYAVCTHCRAPIFPGDRFCESCGASIAEILPSVHHPPAVTTEEAGGHHPTAPDPAQRFAFPRNRNALVAAGMVIVALVIVYMIIQLVAVSLQNPAIVEGSAAGDRAIQPNPTVTPDYQSADIPVNTVKLTTGPVQELPTGTELYVEAYKDSTKAIVTVQFAGGPGQGLIRDNRVILTRSDGTITEGKLNFNERLSEVRLQGSRGTDRLQVLVTPYSGKTYIIMDKLLPFRGRG